ncbi:Transmembrane protein 65 [Trypanosoma melophagium]|uniref:Transmembrane protein 65 n=1 Tax=Trypanosoma melophagium TaxID=715481 RepID=UPI003519DCE4|nr:Transmembrane protein 65 [Trypanosoma melophagium]
MRRFLRFAPPLFAETVQSTRRWQSNDKDMTLNQEELQQLVKMLEADPKLLIDVVGKMDAQSRRRLIVAGGAMEWFGKESAASEIERADVDKDLVISPKDFDHWFESALRRRYGDDHTKRFDSTASDADVAVPILTLAWVAFVAGLPFVGFGFLDNAAMILAGDAIDSTVGYYLNCSVLTCAAMGNIFSGVLGMQVHGVIDKLVRKLNFKTPVLTESQMKGKRVFFAGHIGGTLGIMTGLLLGMLPLLLLDSDETKADHALFQHWDKNGNGYLELEELEQIVVELGLPKNVAAVAVKKYGQDGKLDFEQFQKVRNGIRHGETLFA